MENAKISLRAGIPDCSGGLVFDVLNAWPSSFQELETLVAEEVKKLDIKGYVRSLKFQALSLGGTIRAQCVAEIYLTEPQAPSASSLAIMSRGENELRTAKFHVGDKVFVKKLGTISKISNAVILQQFNGKIETLGYVLADYDMAVGADELELVEGGEVRSIAEEFVKKRGDVSLYVPSA